MQPLRPPATPPPAAARRGPVSVARALTLGALALLLAAAAAVIFVLPEAVRDTPPVPVSAGRASGDDAVPPRAARTAGPETGAAALPPRAAGTAGRETGAGPAPPRTGRATLRPPPAAPPPDPDPARALAQAALGEVLALQARLEAARVSRWGGDDYTAGLARLAAGDDAFARADFASAAGEYDAAGTALAALDQARPQRFEAALAAGAGALAAGDAAAALDAFEVALAIDPASDAARAGHARAQTLEQVFALYRAALAQESAGAVDEARAGLEQVLVIDPLFTEAREALTRVAAAIEERDFRRAMSRALAALERGDRGAARDALAAARGMRAADPSVADGLRRLALAEQRARLASLEAQARTHEDAERWTQAMRSYEQALKVDANAAFANDGLARSRERRAFEQRVDQYLAAPQRLASDASLDDAQRLLAAARAGGPPPPGLEQKLRRLGGLVDTARLPVPVTVRSDGATEVVIHRVARLGRLSRRSLSLRPGRYVAVGTRPGFRDVRREFTVAAGDPATVTIICEERI